MKEAVEVSTEVMEEAVGAVEVKTEVGVEGEMGVVDPQVEMEVIWRRGKEGGSFGGDL